MSPAVRAAEAAVHAAVAALRAAVAAGDDAAAGRAWEARAAARRVFAAVCEREGAEA